MLSTFRCVISTPKLFPSICEPKSCFGPKNYPGSHTKGRVVISDVEPMPTVTADSIVQHHAPPMVMAHFKMREKVSKLAEKRYSAPSHQAGLRLKSVIGYDGRGRNNIIWHPITGILPQICYTRLMWID